MLTDEQITNVANWKHRLLYGGYKQTTGSLKDEHGYCCLGVAAEVLGYGFKEDELGSEYYYTREGFNYRLSGMIAPQDAEALGFNIEVKPHELELAEKEYLDCSPGDSIPNRLFMLSRMNDDGNSFAQIVEFVERMGWDK